MKACYTVISALVASFALGAQTVRGLHAQATRPTYVITVFDTVLDMDSDYPSFAPATFQPFGGHYIIHGGKTVTFDGESPRQIVVIAFSSMEKVLAWRASDAFKKTYDPQKIGKVRAFAVEGVTE
jgi:uncharacterized protein (DUF1330 family)